MLPLFQDINLSWKSFTLFQSNYFDIKVSFSGQLLLHNNCLFLLFQNSHLFGGVIFSEKLLFRDETSPEEALLENRKFFTGVTFWSNYFFRKKSYFSKQELLHSLNFFRKATIWKKLTFQTRNISHYLLFLKNYLFREAAFSKDATFYSSYLSKRATFLKHTFSEELLFHSYGSFPQLHFLFIC